MYRLYFFMCYILRLFRLHNHTDISVTFLSIPKSKVKRLKFPRIFKFAAPCVALQAELLGSKMNHFWTCFAGHFFGRSFGLFFGSFLGTFFRLFYAYLDTSFYAFSMLFLDTSLDSFLMLFGRFFGHFLWTINLDLETL